MLMGAITGLALAVTGCNMPEREPDTNPNPMVGYVNLSDSKTGHTPGLIIDEDRDGLPDYIVPDTYQTGPEYVLFLREGFEPRRPKYLKDSRTRVMDREMLTRAKKSLESQNSLSTYMHCVWDAEAKQKQ